MKLLPLPCLVVGMGLLMALASANAQTNGVVGTNGLASVELRKNTSGTNNPPEFQGFHAGDWVRVKVQKPLVVLGRARLLDILSNNIVVATGGERYAFAKSVTTLSEPKPNALRILNLPTASASALSSGGNPLVAAPAPPDMDALLRGVRDGVLGGFASDPGYEKAGAYFDTTMKDFQTGKINLEDLANQAAKVLAEVDQYPAERAKDPRFESTISTLRDFVRRAKAGEKLSSDSRVE